MGVSNWLKYNGFQFVIVLTICMAFTFKTGLDSDYNNSVCEEIDITVEGIRTGSSGGIKVDFKQTDPSRLIMTIVGPKKFYIKDNKKNEIKDLAKGVYSVVVVGREESFDYCPRHFTIDIR